MNVTLNHSLEVVQVCCLLESLQLLSYRELECMWVDVVECQMNSRWLSLPNKTSRFVHILYMAVC
jgi:hypothetical protein